MSVSVCHGCKQLAELVYTDELDRQYCATCTGGLSITSEELGLQYLLASVPYKEGDRVQCRTAGKIYDGIGTVQKVSFDVEDGGGTPIFPAFLVKIDEPADENSPTEGYYHEICLTRVSES